MPVRNAEKKLPDPNTAQKNALLLIGKKITDSAGVI